MSNNNSYQKPEVEKDSFHCPFCGVHAKHYWEGVVLPDPANAADIYEEVFGGLLVSKSSQCNHCGKYALWVQKNEEMSDEWNMVYPKILTAPKPHDDMPESVKGFYEEARSVSSDSSRAAAALLRVALEKLTEALGEPEGSLNTRIGNLVKKGLSPQVQKALDTVRITANEGGSHSGQIDLTGKDDPEVVNKLFLLVNFIIEKMITEPKEIDENFSNLPQDKIDGVKNRDTQNNNKV